MSSTVFLSAASIDLREWRDVLDAAFRRGGFRVLTQDHSLSSAPGNVKRLLTETIDASDCIIHLAGMGYGSDATDPFPSEPSFQCSWTQFEYYHGHQEKKDIIAFVCAPGLSRAGFEEKGTDAADIARKQRLQREHRMRVERGTFENTPLPNTPADRTSNEPVDSVAALLTAVAAAIGTLHQLDRDACAQAQQELRDLATVISRIEAGVGTANDKLDHILTLLSPPAAAPPFQLPPSASAYFGRGPLITTLADRLRTARRTDVWGGAGMGKTALAAAAIASLPLTSAAGLPASPFPHGVVFLDLYQLKGALDTAWHALANAFDDTLPTDMPADQRAARACAHRQALIILEGAEELGPRLDSFLAVLAPESTLLVLTREESQTAAARRLKLDALLSAADSLHLLRHFAPDVPEPIHTAVQALLGGHPLALTWAGSQLADATQPPASFLRDLTAAPFVKLSEPGGQPEHTLQWMFDRSVRHMDEPTRTVLAAAARISDPFAEDFAAVAGGPPASLARLVQLGFLRVSAEGWHFAHALAAQYARALPLPDGLLPALGLWALDGLTAADTRCRQGEGTAPLGLALAHATTLLTHDGAERHLAALADSLVSHDSDGEPFGIRRGRLDFALRAIEAVRQWQARACAEEMATPAWQRESSVSLNKLGNLAVARGELDAALRSFTEGKAIAERLAASDPANAGWQRDLSISLNKLGDLAVARGERDEALRSFTESKALRERLAASDPANAGWQRDLSVSLEKLGDLAVAQGELDAALRSFTESKAIRERLAASDPANTGWQRDLIISLERLGEIAREQGDMAAAIGHFEKSRDGWTKFIEQDPTNTSLQRGITVPLNNLGELAVARGEQDAALRSFTECHAILERLAASDPANAGWQRDLSVSLNKLGELAVARGEQDAALRSFTESKAIAERLAASDPANAEWQRDVSYSCWLIAVKVFRPQERWAEALALMEQSLAIDERLAATDPTNVMWQNDVRVSRTQLAELREKAGA